MANFKMQCNDKEVPCNAAQEPDLKIHCNGTITLKWKTYDGSHIILALSNLRENRKLHRHK